jgi:trimethylamine--corrinoid protein Co-methyltransferase
MKKASPWRPQLSLMDDGRIEELHQAALRILDEIGLNVHHPRLRERLKQAGARSQNSSRVTLPGEMIADALETVQQQVVIHNRLGNGVMPLGPQQIYFGTGSDLLYTYDSGAGKQRKSTLMDVARAARLCDALDEIDFVMSFALPADVPNEDAEPRQYYAILSSTVKPVIMTSFSGLEALERVHEMAVLTAGGDQAFREKPNYILYGQFVSPLEHDFQALERLIFCAEREIPLIYVPTIMSGASGPITLYGSLALALSETLAGLVMHQLVHPGAPFITGACVSPLDMKTGLFPYGTAEWRIGDLVMAEMSRHYGIPVFGTGGAADSKLIDAQTGAEYASSLLAAALSGTNLIHDVGYLNSGLTGSLESIVLGADIIRWVKRFLNGVDPSPGTLAHEVIAEIGPAGEFLSHDHTYDHLHETVWDPLAFDHQDADTWEAGGSQSYAARALDVAQQVLKKHQPPALQDELQERLKEISQIPP